MGRHHYVYAALDTSGRIGYVGITSRDDPRTRWHEHIAEAKAGDKQWPRFAARWQVLSTHSTRRAAKRRETELIEELRPPWNYAENEQHHQLGKVDRLVEAWQRDPRKRSQGEV
ncbi:MAG: GIY-YIG nuclease family protein, partial [Acidimicrobiales bacterium]